MVQGRRSSTERSAKRTKRGGPAGPSLRTIRPVLVVYVLLVLWNSLIPFQLDFESPSRIEGPGLLGLPTGRINYPDAVTNIAGYVPLGALLALCFWLRTRSLFMGAVLGLVWSAGLSYAVEFVQQYEATRISSAGDWLCNLVGAGVGILCAPLGFALLRQARKRWTRELQASPLVSLTKLYAGVLLVIALVPWSFTAKATLLVQRYRAATALDGAIVRPLIPQPAYANDETYRAAAKERREALERLMTCVYELVTFAVLAALVSRILESDLGFGPWSRVVLTVWVVGGFAALMGALQLCIRFGTGDLLACLSRLCGCLLGMVLYRWIPPHWTERDVLERWGRAGFAAPRSVRFPLIPCAVFVVLFMGWVPFLVTASGEGPVAVNGPMLLPFHHYVQARAPVAFQDFFLKLIRFAALGFVLSLAHGAGTDKERWRRVWAAGFWCAAVAGLIEVVQVFVPTRNPDITDLLLGVLGGMGGVGFHIWFVGYLRSLTGVGRTGAGRSEGGPEVWPGWQPQW